MSSLWAVCFAQVDAPECFATGIRKNGNRQANTLVGTQLRIRSSKKVNMGFCACTTCAIRFSLRHFGTRTRSRSVRTGFPHGNGYYYTSMYAVNTFILSQYLLRQRSELHLAMHDARCCVAHCKYINKDAYQCVYICKCSSVLLSCKTILYIFTSYHMYGHKVLFFYWVSSCFLFQN